MAVCNMTCASSGGICSKSCEGKTHCALFNTQESMARHSHVMAHKTLLNTHLQEYYILMHNIYDNIYREWTASVPHTTQKTAENVLTRIT